MSSAIQNILEQTIGDGARPTKYEAVIHFSDSSLGLDTAAVSATCKTSSFPGKTHSKIDFKYRGRIIPIRGQTKYTQVWDCTFYLTEDHYLKNTFENWIESLDGTNNYFDTTSNKDIETAKLQKSYVKDMIITQLDFNDTRATAKYTIHNAFPISVSSVATDANNTGAISEFAVSFAYSHYTLEVKASPDGNFVDNALGMMNKYATDAIGNALNTLTGQTKQQYTPTFNFTKPQTSKATHQTSGGGYGETGAFK